MKRVPLLILSDAPSSHSGLGRITRELCQRIAADLSDTFKLATLGYGGVGSQSFPWQQYTMCGDPPMRRWFVPELRDAWEDWAQGERGVLMTIWDASRLLWLADPAVCPDENMRQWLKCRPFDLWGYWPVDAEGVNGKLPFGYAPVMKKYDRNLAYTNWARRIMRNSGISAEALPHGIDTTVWKPYPKKQARDSFRQMGFTGLTDSTFLLGVVATNQPRKDWGLAMETAAELLKRGVDVRMWCHVDQPVRSWNIPALAEDYGLTNRVCVSTPHIPDPQMALMYSACDVTLGIGSGEGWGLPLAESLACGVPVVHGNYGGGTDFIEDKWLVEPVAWRYEGICNCKRPVFAVSDWADRCQQDPGFSFFDYITWENAWPEWKKWLLKGVKREATVAVGT